MVLGGGRTAFPSEVDPEREGGAASPSEVVGGGGAASPSEVVGGGDMSFISL